MKVANSYRYRSFSATFKSPATVAGSEGSGGSGLLGYKEKKVTDSEALREAYEERAAILEFDAGMSREDAEKLSRQMTGYEEK